MATRVPRASELGFSDRGYSTQTVGVVQYPIFGALALHEHDSRFSQAQSFNAGTLHSLSIESFPISPHEARRLFEL